MNRWTTSVVMAVTMLAVGACTTAIQVERPPTLDTGSPLRGLEPAAFSVTFGDKRGRQDDVVGLPMRGTLKATIDRPVAYIFSEAMAEELKRNGHKILQVGEQPDVIIEGDVVEYWLDVYHPNFFSIEAKATAKAEVKLKTSRSPSTVLSKLYAGFYVLRSSIGISKSEWKRILEAALLDMLKEMTTDPEFLQGVQSAKTRQ